jgi:hypothetical protein
LRTHIEPSLRLTANAGAVAAATDGRPAAEPPSEWVADHFPCSCTAYTTAWLVFRQAQ